ncbi:hypothetical protein B5P44_01140 [Mycobacterium sp. CBMA 213]|uniref:Uncharacterized protein n=1 Tax=Mycolicibacterium sp. CBMA 213 TaxID=1968788 RepID=A0A343VRM1_9MYCO|nr:MULTISPECIES: hypothetical protein [unclassified Mycolicibacterium]AVN58545.1 hypothetical protein B5P44_p00250 [Mycolicibacterium sp. CBMA 213]MUL61188.1 hypothetical protein [Mycolicibacterium sp. CBMA 335]MUM03425.1 hypothetical protein [Mycolicibacterium sp. CBMA 213]
MKRYLSSAQVATYLGKSRDALNALIRSGNFVEPDVIVGDRFQGWSIETVEQARLEMSGDNVLCNTHGATKLITAIRAAAELVRAYGGDSENTSAGIILTVPARLHVLAARLENEVRSITATTQALSRAVAANQQPDDPALYEQKAITMGFTSFDTVLAPADADDLLRATNLRLVAVSLTDIIVSIPSELQSPITRQVTTALGIERDKIVTHAELLDGATDLFSPPTPN